MINERIEIEKLRNFGLIMALVFFLFFVGAYFELFKYSTFNWSLVVSIIFVFFALVVPRYLVIIYIPWMFFGEKVGAVNTKIILGIIYYGLFTPIALVFKLFRKDPMKRKIDKKITSYKIYSKNKNIEHMDSPFS